MSQAYSDPTREDDPYALPDVEVFYVDADDVREMATQNPDEDSRLYTTHVGGCNITLPGWYWWTCLPGCLPDSDPIGPFDSEQDALDDARDF